MPENLYCSAVVIWKDVLIYFFNQDGGKVGDYKVKRVCSDLLICYTTKRLFCGWWSCHDVWFLSHRSTENDVKMEEAPPDKGDL